MRILHLAYEDPAQPGSGGGSVRTREINRRLADRHEVTAVVAGYPGARPRVQDGVRWEPIGLRRGGKLDRLSYFALLGAAIRTHPHDLLVEDFGAPFSVGFAPLLTRKPVVASVQWLFAAQMRAKYHLPFDGVERAGLRLYDQFIAVSDWLAQTLQARRPRAAVTAIPNGIEPLAFTVAPQAPRHLLFVGRLDIEQKGCDLLLESVARARAILGARLPPLIIVGDGPDQAALERQVERLGLREVVEFRGRVDGRTKYDLMASAYAVLMPSRFETFGMVAVESQAASAAVIAFDVGPLAEVAGGGGARLVPAFDLEAFAREVVTLVDNPALREHLRDCGRQWARRYNWDDLATRQEAYYLEVVERARVGAKSRG
jgi:glycosyltransferase involved in cell wall biosynthesis